MSRLPGPRAANPPYQPHVSNVNRVEVEETRGPTPGGYSNDARSPNYGRGLGQVDRTKMMEAHLCFNCEDPSHGAYECPPMQWFVDNGIWHTQGAGRWFVGREGSFPLQRLYWKGENNTGKLKNMIQGYLKQVQKPIPWPPLS
jgi:hypothetical protein